MKKILFFIIILIITTNCDNEKSSNYQSIDSDLIVKMNEMLGTPSRIFNLSLKTEKLYPCCNFIIVSRSNINDNKIIIEALGVDIENICATAFCPACTTIQIDNLQELNYDIEFIVGNNKSFGKLLCSTTEYKLQMISQIQLKIDGLILKRIPNNLIWGTVGYHNTSSINLVNDFLDRLKAIGAVDISLEDGNYNYFTIENGIINEPIHSGYHFTKSFVYRFSGDKSPVRNLVKEFSKNYGDLLSIRVNGDLGEEYLGWILKMNK